MDSIEIDGVTYTQIPEVQDSSCEGCVAFGGDDVLCDKICNSIKGSCLEKEIIWTKKVDVQKQVELNRFFNRPLTEQIEMFPETLAVTQEEEEDWQAMQKKVATGVTDGSAQRGSIEVTPLDVQVDGGHYKGLKIQPVEFIHANNLGYCEANVVKYITRWRDKGGKKDLEKAKHYIDLLIQLENL